MQEKSWLTTVIGIGEKGNILLSEVQSRMIAEETDAKKEDGMALCHYWSLPIGTSIDTASLEQNCRDIAVAFLLIDVSDAKSIKSAQEIGKFVSTQKYAVSIALLVGADSPSNAFDGTFSFIDAAVDLIGAVDTGDFAPAHMAYSVIRGINSLIVKPGMVGLDVADMNEQFQKAGMLHIGLEIAREHGTVGTLQAATESALSQMSVVDAKRVLLCIDGNEDTLDMHMITVAAEITQLAMPEADIVFGATVSKSATHAVQVLILASDKPLV